MFNPPRSVPVRARLAPTPSGMLHSGNGLNFLLTWAVTRAQNGQLLLRIDDLDQERYREKYAEEIFRTIDWLGIDYDEGPTSVMELQRDWSQLLRRDLYREAQEQLRQAGQLFACVCSRRTIRKHSEDGSYPNLCLDKDLPFDQPNTAWRVRPALGPEVITVHQLIAPDEVLDLSTLDACVVRQKNDFTAYQLSSIIDDSYFRINTIVRGLDLLRSTHYQLYLASRLENTAFLNTRFYHHGMLLDENGEKLAKSNQSTSLQSLRAAGQTPAPLFQEAARMLGLEGACRDGKTLLKGLKATISS